MNFTRVCKWTAAFPLHACRTPSVRADRYIRLARPADGEPASCGLDITPLDGNGCIGGAPNVTVCGQGGLLFDAVYPLVL
jgi:cathepsin L